MKITKKTGWIFAVVVLVLTTAMVRKSISNMIFLPVVIADATLTPTPSQTPTPTPTPTLTPRPSGVQVVEVVQSDTMDPLNEYVSIHNFTSSSVDLTGWFIRDDGTNRYDFPINFYVPSGKTVRVWTKDGANTTTDLYWNNEFEVWNDVRDCAYLRDDSEGENKLVHTYCYDHTEDGILIILTSPPH